jgi:hypothetical protein
MLLTKTPIRIFTFLFLLVVFAVSTFLFIVAQEPLWEIDQSNQTSTSSFKNLSPRADFVKLLPDILIRNMDYEFIDDTEWLTFNFEKIDDVANKKNKLVISTDYEATPYLSFVIEEASEKYVDGSLLINNKMWKGDLGFITLQKASWITSLSYRLVDQSQLFYLMIVVLACFVITFVLSVYIDVRQVKSISFVSYLLLLAILALFFSLPLYINSSTTGVWDWPEAASHYSAARLSFAAGEFPLWTPQFCGGAPMWQSPQAYWPSLTFLITLLFGDLVGSRIAISVYIFLGLWGMTKLSRHFGLIYPFALIPAIIFMFSGFLLSHLAAGQMLWLTVAWIPWTIYFFLKSFKKPWFILPAVLFYLMTFFEGRVYITVYLTILILIFSLVIGFITKKWKQSVSRLIGFAFLVIFLGAIKIIPTIDFLSNFSGGLEPEEGIPITRLLEVMTTRTAELEYAQPWMYLYWHEYAAYIGIVPLLLALLGVFVVSKTKRATYIALILSALLFLFVATSKIGTNPFNLFPVLKQLHVPGRSILMVIFSISLLAGLGAQSLIKKGLWQQILGLSLALILFANLFIISLPAWNNIFSKEYVRLEEESSFHQSSWSSDNAYHLTEAGLGAKDYCPTYLRTWHSGAKIYGHEEDEYMGEVYVLNSSVVSLSKITPNSVAVLVEEVKGNDTVYVNQKYDSGWRSKDKELFSDEGRLAFNIAEKDKGKKIVIRYLPKSFVVGSFITLFSIVLLVVWSVFRKIRN